MLASFLTGCLVRSTVYPAPGIAVPPDPPSGHEEVRLELSNGVQVSAWWNHNQSLPDSAPALLYLHGNGENLETMRLSGVFGTLANMGAHVMAIDYPGYGRSTGTPSERSVLEACDTALQWLAGRHPESRRILCGWSLGAAAAISTAARNPVLADGLVAMSAWTTLIDVASRFYPRFLVKILVRDRYNSLVAIQRVKCPVLLIHGREDGLIPLRQGEKLAAAAPTLRRWVSLAGAEHNDLLDSPVVWAEIRAFIQTLSVGAGNRSGTD
jgi:pimeloyl-ACP methyl ester carboxylesterase